MILKGGLTAACYNMCLLRVQICNSGIGGSIQYCQQACCFLVDVVTAATRSEVLLLLLPWTLCNSAAVRGFGSQTARCFDTGSSGKLVGQLLQLRVLSVRCSMSSSATLLGVCQLSSLVQLEMSLAAPLSR